MGVSSTKASNTNRNTAPQPVDKSKGKAKRVFAEVVDSDTEDAQSDPRKRLSPSSSNTISESAPPSDSNSGASGDDSGNEQIANGNRDGNEDQDSDVNDDSDEVDFSLDSAKDLARQLCRTTVLFADFTHILLAGQTRYNIELEGEDDADKLEKIM